MKFKKWKPESIKTIALYIFLACTVRWGLAEAYRIPSESMNPTLKPGDMIFVNKAQYGVRIPFTQTWLWETGDVKRGDVVVFRYPQDTSTFYIKRVIGLPGETISLDASGTVFVNGHSLDETYTAKNASNVSARASFGPIQVPAGQLFVLGDNRDNSSDSRVWGFVPKELVMGKATFKWFSWVD